MVTESDLISWYEKALRGKYAADIGSALISTLCTEIIQEFPSIDDIPDAIKARNYENISDPFWT